MRRLNALSFYGTPVIPNPSMSDPDLERLCRSPEAPERLRALRQMRAEIDAGAPPERYLALARLLVADSDNDCRWQALIVVGEAVETSPEAVWGVAREHMESDDEDMQAGVATVLLEHLLEHHFDWTLGRLRHEIKGGSAALAGVLALCSPFGAAVSRWGEVERLRQGAL